MGRKPRWESNEQRLRNELAKDELCYALQRIQQRKDWSQKTMAAYLGTSQSCVSRATRTESARKMSYNQLFRYLSRADPNFRLMISI